MQKKIYVCCLCVEFATNCVFNFYVITLKLCMLFEYMNHSIILCFFYLVSSINFTTTMLYEKYLPFKKNVTCIIHSLILSIGPQNGCSYFLSLFLSFSLLRFEHIILEKTNSWDFLLISHNLWIIYVFFLHFYKSLIKTNGFVFIVHHFFCVQ